MGVNAVLDAVVAGPSRTARSSSGELTGSFTRWPRFARAAADRGRAANWLALATLAARLIPEERGLLIDIGTTTTDLIPLDRGTVAARGRSDTERLQTGELVYAGVRRTPVCALATELPLRGIPTGLAAELFASTLDVYLTLGDIDSDPADLSTADGRPADGARRPATAWRGWSAPTATASPPMTRSPSPRPPTMPARSSDAARPSGPAEPTIGRPTAAVVAGSGDFLARRLARRVIEPDGPIVSLKEAWGAVASSAGCAYALVTLASERFRTRRETRLDNPRSDPISEADPA